ncbi:MAG: transglycosylase SLT domain-containing protein [Gammaproteobacteria bacterium]|nr:transglycosylase SLT domain-containing protein [Gammaproteobacteria bacterium]
MQARLANPTASLRALAAPVPRVSEDTLQNALRSSELRRFRETAPLIRKYARRYGFDWLLIMSQAYQESRFDQGARSSKGAVGIMQVMPSTAADRVVGIPDIYNAENNVHAGNKYLRFLHDQYVESRAMSDLDKTLFAMASYNAGPARVSDLRAEATGEGLDPNVWFDSVERIAARRIGRETVDYVGNIYSYWIAYGLNRERIERSVRARPAALLPPDRDGPGSGPVLCSIAHGGAILCESIGVHRPVIRTTAVNAALSARIREQRRMR